MDIQILTKIVEALDHAREKHPEFAENMAHATNLALEELGEMAKAVNDGKLEEVRDEALDTIAVLVRILEKLGVEK